MDFIVWLFAPVCFVACRQATSQWRDGDGTVWLWLALAFGFMLVVTVIAPFTLPRS